MATGSLSGHIAAAVPGAWIARAIRRYPYTSLVFLAGIIIRAILIPITHGNDFIVWDLASRATLAGSNIYAHHPHGYPGGPYTYPPLFLYSELPFQWLTLHLGLSFVILGKLPIVAGDLLTAALLTAYLARRGHDERIIALGAALYFLNPLVLYNGAFYGRFDAFCVGLFLLALCVHDAPTSRLWRFPLLYAAAVAAKTYPIFVLPWLWRREPARRGRLLAALVAVVGGISLPYLVTSPIPFFRDVIFYNSAKLPGNLSWQIILLHAGLSPNASRALSLALLGLFVVALFPFTRLDLLTYCAVAILLFMVFSKVLIEQYFLWPMPFLIIAALQNRSWASGGLLLLLSATGTLINPFVHINVLEDHLSIINVLVAAAMAAYILTRRPVRSAPGRPYTAFYLESERGLAAHE